MQTHFYRSGNPESNLENHEKPERPPEALYCLKLYGVCKIWQKSGSSLDRHSGILRMRTTEALGEGSRKKFPRDFPRSLVGGTQARLSRATTTLTGTGIGPARGILMGLHGKSGEQLLHITPVAFFTGGCFSIERNNFFKSVSTTQTTKFINRHGPPSTQKISL